MVVLGLDMLEAGASSHETTTHCISVQRSDDISDLLTALSRVLAICYVSWLTELHACKWPGRNPSEAVLIVGISSPSMAWNRHDRYSEFRWCWIYIESSATSSKAVGTESIEHRFRPSATVVCIFLVQPASFTRVDLNIPVS